MSIRLLRSLDGIFYALLAFVLLHLYETFGVVALHRKPTLFTIIPLAGLYLATLYLPVPKDAPQAISQALVKLKMLTLALLGFYPFVPWHLRGTGSIYLTLGAGTALTFGALYARQVMEVLDLLIAPGKHNQRLRTLSTHLRQAVGYLFLTPVITVYIFLIYHINRQNVPPARLLTYAWASLHPGIQAGVKAVIAIYTIAFLLVLWSSRNCVRLRINDREIHRS